MRILPRVIFLMNTPTECFKDELDLSLEIAGTFGLVQCLFIRNIYIYVYIYSDIAQCVTSCVHSVNLKECFTQKC